MNVSEQIASRVRELRAAQGLSLEVLADRTGVSKSNISLIERAEGNPTASVLDRLATGLNVVLASLFEASAASMAKPKALSRATEQTVWTDPSSGYVRRSLSPALGSALQLVEVHFPPGQKVAYETGTREVRIDQQLWVIEGEMHITLGLEQWQLRKGDCLSMRLDQPCIFSNPSKHPTRYLVAITNARGKD
jgi:transcriptional regulator with XRE-family HTH domain